MGYCRWFLQAETSSSELRQIIIVTFEGLFSLLIIIIVMIML